MNDRELTLLLQRCGQPRVLVVGDLILDRYVSGDVSRISPEAPIPILLAKRTEERLGGAGNVAANLVSMGAQVDVVGVLGDDGWGSALRELLEEQGIGPKGCVLDAPGPATQQPAMLTRAPP